MDKLSTFVPVIKQKQSMLSEHGPKVTFVKMEYLPDDNYYYEIPYLQKIEEIRDRISLEEEKRIFLVTDEDNIAIKTAYNYVIYPVYELREEMMEEMASQITPDSRIILRNPDGSDLVLRIISLQGEKKTEGTMSYYQALNAGVSENNAVLYSGLEDNSNLSEKLDVILTSPAKLQFIQISKDQLGLPWMRELMMERDCEVIMLPKISDSYYVTVLKKLLDGERCKLDEGLLPEHLVRNLRKKCTNKFREEDLAWSLDQAAQKAKSENRYVLYRTDFSIEKEEEEPALQILERMTGLNEMKQMAKEYAALSREQAKNEKIALISKHAIYVGAPGTGKTECGKLLAKIMAEEGQSNGSFFMASRKDIIGEYIGHTAPKIAKLFQKSRNGVLFIDEAGFLLQESRGSFNSEAIKEFVRYMELYQDVTVVFALYPHEVDDWMQLDAGLSSRISRIVKFENYTTDELLQIGQSMCRDRGYQPAEDTIPEITSYLEKRMQILKEKFGNAREIRKLVEAAIIAKSIRCFNHPTGHTEQILCREDFHLAIARLSQEKQERKRTIGFMVGGETYD